YAGVYRAQTNLEREAKDGKKADKKETIEGFEIPFAINVPVSTNDQKYSESDLSKIDADQLSLAYPGWKFRPPVRDPLVASLDNDSLNPDAQYVPKPVGPDLANIALLIMLGLLFLEVLLAWHFGHYTVTEGAIAKTTPSATITGIAAAV